MGEQIVDLHMGEELKKLFSPREYCLQNVLILHITGWELAIT